MICSGLGQNFSAEINTDEMYEFLLVSVSHIVHCLGFLLQTTWLPTCCIAPVLHNCCEKTSSDRCRRNRGPRRMVRIWQLEHGFQMSLLPWQQQSIRIRATSATLPLRSSNFQVLVFGINRPSHSSTLYRHKTNPKNADCTGQHFLV